MHNITVLISENSPLSRLSVSYSFCICTCKRRFAPSFAVTRFRGSSTVGRHNTPHNLLLILEAQWPRHILLYIPKDISPSETWMAPRHVLICLPCSILWSKRLGFYATTTYVCIYFLSAWKKQYKTHTQIFFELFSLWVAQLAANFQQLCELSELVKYLKKSERESEADGQNYSLSVVLISSSEPIIRLVKS